MKRRSPQKVGTTDFRVGNGIVKMATVTAYHCERCRKLSAKSAGSFYECCGTRYTRDESADGRTNRCPQCLRFGSSTGATACIDCGVGEVEEVTAVWCEACEAPVTLEECSTHFTDAHLQQVMQAQEAEAARVKAEEDAERRSREARRETIRRTPLTVTALFGDIRVNGVVYGEFLDYLPGKARFSWVFGPVGWDRWGEGELRKLFTLPQGRGGQFDSFDAAALDLIEWLKNNLPGAIVDLCYEEEGENEGDEDE